MFNLFLDMDGTLAEFKPEATMEDMYTPGYFENLKPNKNVIKGIEILARKHPEINIAVLSCILPDRENAVLEKENWLSKYCSLLSNGKKYFLPCGSDKSQVIEDGENFLLDDYSVNLLDFEKSGHGIKLLNGVNGQGVKWQGPRISYLLTPEEIADGIYENMLYSL